MSGVNAVDLDLLLLLLRPRVRGPVEVIESYAPPCCWCWCWCLPQHLAGPPLNIGDCSGFGVYWTPRHFRYTAWWPRECNLMLVLVLVPVLVLVVREMNALLT